MTSRNLTLMGETKAELGHVKTFPAPLGKPFAQREQEQGLEEQTAHGGSRAPQEGPGRGPRSRGAGRAWGVAARLDR